MGTKSVKCRTTGETRAAHVDHLKTPNYVDSVSPYPEESQVDPPKEETPVQTEGASVPRDPYPEGDYNLRAQSVNAVAYDQTDNAKGNCRHSCPREVYVPWLEIEK